MAFDSQKGIADRIGSRLPEWPVEETIFDLKSKDPESRENHLPKAETLSSSFTLLFLLGQILGRLSSRAR